ncbi:MAG: LuxR C-terminal-related transcriptional regulator [Planctomycetota bacterium]
MSTNDDTRPATTPVIPLASDAVWQAITSTPGVGVSVIDVDGKLVFVNPTTSHLFFVDPDADYHGKYLTDFHPEAFVRERLAMIRQVLDQRKPLSIRHIYLGRGITSTVWPLSDEEPPFDRVLVVSREHGQVDLEVSPNEIETIETEYIDLGHLSALTPREVEVLALLGQGLGVPQVANCLHRSPKTIEHHKASISQKLHLRGQAELVTIVAGIGLEISDAKLKRYKREP